ncbi:MULTISPECIES: sugar ABC transporter substrate-binding protein [unclassified Modestobacter]|uniref:sugar ABC transporter substrate-binding protein n=1 Tax=unclassified Modestobacter TaxID=2643866 RepID=UPI0022AAB14E|nr:MULTISPECIES: sugar ABC transporter substrate-binding protein [unclassified Modestobacter]MCZ2811360.1 sugar ABC transporter substrate-binding protein [Modestobacter sp. VKM Ac-2979]MCZ2840873.1 sugar ABC transporter substrate-binding protein [Modestobacter sp. VKM Ac-2980]MCZ2848158.1 sugar ABC transporter substrate-binding protein [Modestobacter sp. VKM Ac-2978]
MARPMRLLALALAAPLLLSACSTENSGDGGGDEGGDGGGAAASGDLDFAVVTHGAAGDAFWDVVQNGAEAAGEDLGVGVDYQSDGDPQRQSQLIEAAVNQDVDGIVVSMANPDALEDSISAATEAGIPVVTINSGAERSAEFGAIGHVGQDETIAGIGAGQRLAQDGATNVLCVVHEAGNIGLEQRCDGASQGLGSDVQLLQVDINDLQAAQSTITSQLQSNPSIDAVLTLNSAVASVAASAAADAGSDAAIATFDLNADVISAIQDGTISFAVDQQQYEQGYLPVVMLKLYAENLNTVGGGQAVLTGPGIVDAENVDEIADLASAGTR